MTSMLLSLVVFLAGIAGSLGQQVSCPPEGVSYLPLPDCTKYIVCDNGHPFEMECPPSLYYSTAIEECDFPENVPECVGGTREPISGSTTTPIPSTNTPTDEPTTTTEGTTITTPTQTTTTTTTTEGPTEEPEPGVLTRCGDTLEANSGAIKYKLSQEYSEGELCSFVIRLPDHSGILFKLHSHGINESSDENAINIFTFTQEGQIDGVHMGPPNPLTERFVIGALAVVVFQTNSNLGTGFHLSFEGVGTTAYSEGEEFVFSDMAGGELVVPSWPNYHGTTTAIVLTANHRAILGDGKLRMVISDEDLYTCGGSIITCSCDSLRVFSFNSQHTVEEGLFCSEEIHRSVYETNGLLIVIFRKFYDGGWATAKLNWEFRNIN